ncbi:MULTISPECIES: queuosine precursor transporter [unclassified Luteococcus]|uniref:queuosine precursor transporter n=1 Tax=unclassified Luteococcus TaxID=2639923 RepID=UPI00313D9085
MTSTPETQRPETQAPETPEPRGAASYAEVPRSYYDIVMAVFVGLLLISGVTATKLFEGPRIPFFSDWFYGGGPLIFDGGAFLFPLSYVVGDIMTEVYGWRRAKRAIWTGFALTFLAAVTYRIVSLTHPVPGFEAWDGVLSPVTRITVAGLAGYLAGNLLNSLVVVRLKARAGESNVAARLIGSTLVGELVDTLIFCTIAFAGTISLAELGNYTVTGYVYKCLVEVCVVPITLQIIKYLKRVEPSYGR